MTKICDFPKPIYDLIKNLIPIAIYDLTARSLGALNGVEEGKAWMGERGHDEKVGSSKKKRIED